MTDSASKKFFSDKHIMSELRAGSQEEAAYLSCDLGPQ
jgi:hypothetical protein